MAQVEPLKEIDEHQIVATVKDEDKGPSEKNEDGEEAKSANESRFERNRAQQQQKQCGGGKISRGRFRSVRTKATSFSGWRDNVRSAWQQQQEADEDLELLTGGTRLWKVRRKPWIIGTVASYRRRFVLDVDSLCVLQSDPDKSKCEQDGGRAVWKEAFLFRRRGSRGKTAKGVIDVANVVEVRQGFATDVFNDVDKKVGLVDCSHM